MPTASHAASLLQVPHDSSQTGSGPQTRPVQSLTHSHWPSELQVLGLLQLPQDSPHTDQTTNTTAAVLNTLALTSELQVWDYYNCRKTAHIRIRTANATAAVLNTLIDPRVASLGYQLHKTAPNSIRTTNTTTAVWYAAIFLH